MQMFTNLLMIKIPEFLLLNETYKSVIIIHKKICGTIFSEVTNIYKYILCKIKRKKS